MSAEGAVLFARYAYPPNELGYCGPEGAEAMLDPEAIADIERRAPRFEGAWSYLELIAESLGMDDPLDTAVVDAYWVGSDLLDRVDPAVLMARLEDRFATQVGGTWRQAGTRARAHHSFQVFEVYPWARMLQEGRPSAPAVSVLDRCRIRIGIVRETQDGAVTAETRTLVWDGSAVQEDEPAVERLRWSVDGRALMDAPLPGDQVAVHWDWVCDVVTPEQARRIEELEKLQRAAIGLGASPLRT